MSRSQPSAGGQRSESMPLATAELYRASQQADAAAESIAAVAGADVEPLPFRPVLRA
jgi:hypothetical protein